MEKKELLLLGIGNPLLDISATVESSFIQKYNLKDNSSSLTTEETIFEDIESSYDVTYTPGGSTLNAIRVSQWFFGASCPSTAFFGSVGNDSYSELLSLKLKEDSVTPYWDVKETLTTGRCAALITGSSRCLVGQLNAAITYDISHLRANWSTVKEAQGYISTGYFLMVCSEALFEIGSHASSCNKVFAFNLSSTYICRDYMEPLLQILPYVDVLFGNQEEAFTFGTYASLPFKDIYSIAKHLSSFSKMNERRSRIVIISNGAQPVLVAMNSRVVEYEVIPVPDDQFKDTNGSGDGLMGGFIAKFIKGESISESVKSGIKMAALIIQQTGCTLPPFPYSPHLDL